MVQSIELLDLPTLDVTLTVHPTLIYDEDNVILVDCGYPGTLESLEIVLKDKGFQFLI